MPLEHASDGDAAEHDEHPHETVLQKTLDPVVSRWIILAIGKRGQRC